MRCEYFMGVDLGQRRDRTAVAILERAELIAERPDPITWERARTFRLQVRHLERMPLGTPYTGVVDRVDRIARAVAKTGLCTLAVDATGVGLPVIDALKIPGAPWRLMPVTINHSQSEAYGD